MPSPLDTDALRALLDRMAITTDSLVKSIVSERRSSQLASAVIHPRQGILDYSIHPLAIRQLSNHEQLRASSFIEARRDDIVQLRKTIISAIPALDHDHYHMVLGIHHFPELGSRFVLNIGGFSIHERTCSLTGIVERLDRLARDISDLPPPGDRKFRGGPTLLSACDEVGARRLHAALCPKPPNPAAGAQVPQMLPAASA